MASQKDTVRILGDGAIVLFDVVLAFICAVAGKGKTASKLGGRLYFIA